MQERADGLFKSNLVLIILKQRNHGWKGGRISINRSSLKSSLRMLPFDRELEAAPSWYHTFCFQCAYRERSILLGGGACVHVANTAMEHSAYSNLNITKGWVICIIISPVMSPQNKLDPHTQTQRISIMTCLGFFYLCSYELPQLFSCDLVTDLHDLAYPYCARTLTHVMSTCQL